MKTISTLLLLLAISFNIQAQDPTPLSESQFEKLRKEVAEQSFDSKRMIKAKELSDAHFLYVSQIKAILESLSLEGNRLEYAKYAYASTLDAENYKNLFDNFRLSANQDDLKDYISKREPPVIPGKKETPVVVEESNTSTTTSSTTTTTTIKKTTGPMAMTDQDFAVAKRAVEGEEFESKKLRRVKQTSDANYLLCSQIVELMDILSFESSRLEYAQYAYEKTFDQANYSIVKEQLKHSKSKEELTAFLKDKPVNDYTVVEEEVVVAENPVTVDNAESAETVISKEDFANLRNQIASQSSDSKKMEKAKTVIDRTYFTTEQIKSIVDLFIFDESRLEFAKIAYYRTSDQENFASIKDLLETESKKAFEDFIKNAPEVTNDVATPTGPSELSNEDFEALLKKIHNQSLESHKLDKAKIIVDRSHVSAAQVKKILGEFTLEETRLEYAKYAYAKTLDKENYSVVREALNKSTSKYKLDHFIKEQK